jgi:FkbM family methyltransferase
MPRAIRQLVARSPLGPPLRWVYELLHPPGPAELRDREDTRWIEAIMTRVLRPDSNCVDAGCFHGDMLRRMIERAPRGRHYAFEPLPLLAADLRRRFPRVKVIEAALGDAAGRAEYLHVVNMPAYSGLRRRPYPETPDIRTIEVRTTRLDDVLPADDRVDLLKVDVEGGEGPLFRGAERTLKTWRPHVIFEHGRDAARVYDFTPAMVFDQLASCGLCISGLAAWLEGAPPYEREAFGRADAWNFIAHPPRE